MQADTPKLLEDIRDAAEFVLDVTRDSSEATYEQNRLVRQAVERNLQVIGEALNRLRKTDPATAEHIGDVSRIVAFRNILVHGYDIVDHTIVWHVIQDHLPSLATTVRQLLAEVGFEDPPVT